MMSRKFLLKALEDLEVRIITGADVVKKEDSRVSLMIREKEVHIEHVDFVFYTKGMVTERSLENRLKGKTKLFLVGDCEGVGRAMDAIHSAHECAVSV